MRNIGRDSTILTNGTHPGHLLHIHYVIVNHVMSGAHKTFKVLTNFTTKNKSFLVNSNPISKNYRLENKPFEIYAPWYVGDAGMLLHI
jgi:hypothetical protein